MVVRSFSDRTSRALAGAAVALLLAGSAAQAGTLRVRPDTITQTTNTTGEGFAFINTNAAGGGLLGEVGSTLYTAATHAGLAGVFEPSTTTVGYGVFGLSKTGYGMYGNSTAVGYAGVYGVGVANGVLGLSTVGNGVAGKTSGETWYPSYLVFPFDSTSYHGHAGVIGEDVSVAAPDTNHVNENAGVLGLSAYGLAGVLGILTAASPTGSTAGVLGTNLAANQEGVFGHDASTSTGSSGLYGSSTDGTGTTTFSNTGEGLNAYSGNSTGAEIDNATLNDVPTLWVQSGNNSASVPAVLVSNNFGGQTRNDIFSIADSGDVVATGSITGSASPLAVTRGSHGASYVAYGARTSTPTIEDVGFGTMTAGYAAVRLDPAFASTIDARANYAVFISPEGENDGLYVTAKTAASFVVREVHGGKSSLTFSYRIVARPLDMPLAQRLPDARTAVVRPVFDDRKARAADAIRRAQRERIVGLSKKHG
jgi:hypothetical protein